MKSGKVTVWPELKLEITKSSIESAKASSAAAEHAGRDQGQRHAFGTSSRRRAEIPRRLLEPAVEADQP